jgi:hypothetical protein
MVWREAMHDEEDWGYLERPEAASVKPPEPAPTTLADPVAKLAHERINVATGIKVATERLEEIDRQLVEEFPTDIGEYIQEYDGYLVTLKRGDRWAWDTRILRDMYGVEPPAFIKKTYTISRTAYEKLDKEAKDDLKAALSVTRAGAKVSVQKM